MSYDYRYSLMNPDHLNKELGSKEYYDEKLKELNEQLKVLQQLLDDLNQLELISDKFVVDGELLKRMLQALGGHELLLNVRIGENESRFYHRVLKHLKKDPIWKLNAKLHKIKKIFHRW